MTDTTEEIPSLEQRALTEEGMKVLQYVADRQRKCMPAFIRHMARTTGRNRNNRSSAMEALATANLIIEITKGELAGDGKRMGYALTERGWEVAGNKPIWL